MKRRTWGLVASVAVFALWAAGQERKPEAVPPAATRPAMTTPAATQAATQELVWPAEVVLVQGVVQVREGESQPWAKAQVGMKVGKAAQVRTGPRSAIGLRTADGRVEVTLDLLGTHGVKELLEAPLLPENLGPPYGRVRYDVEAAGAETDPRIHTPGARLRIRGQRMALEPLTTRPTTQVATQPTTRAAVWPLEVIELQGIAQVREAEDRPWMPARVGMKVGQMAEIRTGPRSALKLRAADGRTFAWEKLKTMKASVLVGEEQPPAGEGANEHGSIIRTPGSTLHVRG